MVSSLPILEINARAFSGAKGVLCSFVGLFLVMYCTSTAGQTLTLQNPANIGRQKGPFAEQLVTANDLRVPAKARRAFEKAATAQAHDQQKEAEKQIAYALELYPDYAKALTLRAVWKMHTEPSDSIKDLEHAIQADPAYGIPYAVLASIYNDFRRYDDALPVVQRATQLLPTVWQVHYEMARTLWGKKRTPEALREVTHAVLLMAGDAAADPESQDAVHYLRGLLLIDEHEFASARSEFEL